MYDPIIDIRVLKKDIPEKAKEFFNTYAVDHGKGYLLLNTDNARFTNHSDNPNTESLGIDEDNVALRNIHIGEEITIDYNKIDVNGVDF